MLDRVPRPIWILSLLAMIALGLALGTNALVARLMVVDAGRLAAAHDAAPGAVARSTPDGEGAPTGETVAADTSSSRRDRAKRPRRLNYFQDPILRRNIFNSAAGPEAPTPAPGGPEGPDVPKSEIDAVLISTAVASDPVWSTAIVSVASSGAEPYRIGDPIADATVVDIKAPWLDIEGTHHPARLIVLRDGQHEYIDAGGKPKAGSKRKPKKEDGDKKKKKKRTSGRHTWDGIHDLGGGKYSVDQSEIDYAMGNLDKLSREARVVPNFADGQTNGWKVFSIRRNSALRKMGLKNNDVLTSVNGMDLGDTEKALEVYSKLQSDKSFTLEVLRNGEPTTLEYTVQ